MCNEDCCNSCSDTDLPVGPQGPPGPQGPVGPAGSSPIDVNMVAKGTGPSITESQIFDNGQFVGVNTLIPEAKMHIKGDDDLEESLTLKITNDSGITSLITNNFGNTSFSQWGSILPLESKLNVWGDYEKPVVSMHAANLHDFTTEYTQFGDFDNTTDPLVITLDIANYPFLLSKLYANMYLRIGTELLKCILAYEVTPTTRNYTFERGKKNTPIVAHPDGEAIEIVIMNAFHMKDNGCIGFGTDDPFDTLELHIKASLRGGISIYQDDNLQDPDGTYGFFKNRGEPKGICRIFLCETGGISSSPYDVNGDFCDPVDSIHIGYGGGLAGGIVMDRGGANITWRAADPYGGTIRAVGNGIGWIKIHGDNSLIDLSGATGEDFRIGTDGNGTDGKGLYFFTKGVSGWVNIIKSLNSAVAEPSLEFFPAGVGSIKVSGLTGADGTFTSLDGKTITVTKGIITNIV